MSDKISFLKGQVQAHREWMNVFYEQAERVKKRPPENDEDWATQRAIVGTVHVNYHKAEDRVKEVEQRISDEEFLES